MLGDVDASAGRGTVAIIFLALLIELVIIPTKTQRMLWPVEWFPNDCTNWSCRRAQRRLEFD